MAGKLARARTTVLLNLASIVERADEQVCFIMLHDYSISCNVDEDKGDIFLLESTESLLAGLSL